MKSFSWSAQRPGPFVASWLIMALSLFLAGCGRENIQVYRVPKETPEMANPHGSGSAMHGQAAALPQLQYQAPSGWQEMALGSMRAAHFSISGSNSQKAEVSAIPLPGATAPPRDIVNMWRTQVTLKPVSESDLAGLAEKVEIGSAQGQLFEMTSTEPILDHQFKAAVVGALLKQEETLWVFKLSGAAELVHAQKPAFLSFLKSVRFTGANPAAPGESQPSGSKEKTASASATIPQKPVWEVPAHWKEQPPSQMVVAKFVITGAGNAQTEVSVSAFPGDVGGLLANVNRWRAQLGLAPIEEPELKNQTSSFDVMGGRAVLVDLTGASARSGQKARLLAAIVQRGDQTWFYKMIGEESLAAREREAFIKFVQSVRYPNAG